MKPTHFVQIHKFNPSFKEQHLYFTQFSTSTEDWHISYAHHSVVKSWRHLFKKIQSCITPKWQRLFYIHLWTYSLMHFYQRHTIVIFVPLKLPYHNHFFFISFNAEIRCIRNEYSFQRKAGKADIMSQQTKDNVLQVTRSVNSMSRDKTRSQWGCDDSKILKWLKGTEAPTRKCRTWEYFFFPECFYTTLSNSFFIF